MLQLKRAKRYYGRILRSPALKRALDLAVALPCVVLFLPLMAAISTLIWALYGSPIIFRQERTGLGGVPFVMYKFRTMKDAYDKKGNLLPDNKRKTRFGEFLRKSSLDELPELFNVLKGEMSIVGPRPLLHSYTIYYSGKESRRHRVKPGMTGWAQINGRNAIGWKEKFELDMWYVDHRNILLDLKIILLTFLHLFRRTGIDASKEETMPLFKGTD